MLGVTIKGLDRAFLQGFRHVFVQCFFKILWGFMVLQKLDQSCSGRGGGGKVNCNTHTHMYNVYIYIYIHTYIYIIDIYICTCICI